MVCHGRPGAQSHVPASDARPLRRHHRPDTGGILLVRSGGGCAVISALALLAPDSLLHAGARWIFTGIAMGIDMWVSAAYVILRADRLSTAWE